jgi:hypothetical protein
MDETLYIGRGITIGEGIQIGQIDLIPEIFITENEFFNFITEVDDDTFITEY